MGAFMVTGPDVSTQVSGSFVYPPLNPSTWPIVWQGGSTASVTNGATSVTFSTSPVQQNWHLDWLPGGFHMGRRDHGINHHWFQHCNVLREPGSNGSYLPWGLDWFPGETRNTRAISSLACLQVLRGPRH